MGMSGKPDSIDGSEVTRYSPGRKDQMLAQVVVERTNPLGLVGHGISPGMKR